MEHTGVGRIKMEDIEVTMKRDERKVNKEVKKNTLKSIKKKKKNLCNH